MVSTIAAHGQILKPGKIDTVTACQRPYLRGIVLQAVPFQTQFFIKEFSFSVISVASW